MARRKENTEMNTEANVAENLEASAETGVETAAPEAKVEEPKVDERFKLITHPETGEQVKRKDFILECWTVKRMSRGDIAKKLSELAGKKVAYQIVFSATKGVAGGPVQVEAAPAAEQAAE